MKSLFQFVVSPLNNEQYINTKKIGDVDLIVNTSIENASDTQRQAVVVAVPLKYKGEIKAGQIVIVHHNVFRVTLNDKGVARQSNNYLKDNLFYVSPDLIYMVIRNGKKHAVDQFCFVEPIIENDFWEGDREVKHIGIMKYPNIQLISNGVNPGDQVCFKANSEYEFNIDGERLYMMNDSRVLAKLN